MRDQLIPHSPFFGLASRVAPSAIRACPIHERGGHVSFLAPSRRNRESGTLPHVLERGSYPRRCHHFFSPSSSAIALAAL